MTWTRGSVPSGPGEYVVDVGGVKRLATWNARDGRWFDGYRLIDPRFVRGFLQIPDFNPRGRDECDR